MPSRLVLMGAKEGAWCAIDSVRRPVLRVNGLQGGSIGFEILSEDRVRHHGGLSEDGDYDLRDWFKHVESPFYWIRVSATDPTSDLVCLVVPKPKAA